MIYLGIDTSCYTTSLAAVGETGLLLSDCRKPLRVPMGQRGLRQSEGFYQHINSFADLYQQLLSEAGGPLAAVAVSSRPRAQSGSYMPVFYAGLNLAKAVSLTAGVPLYHTDHQQGHLAAAQWQSGLQEPAFLCLHISGGTTELLYAEEKPAGYACEILAATGDISAGQLLDRVGVAMELPFPAGPFLSELAAANTLEPIPLPTRVEEGRCSFSGAETEALKALQNGADKRAVAAGVLQAILRTLCKLIVSGAVRTSATRVLLMGGVASSEYLRERLPVLVSQRNRHIQLTFAPPRLSGDNAVGVALLAKKLHQKQ